MKKSNQSLFLGKIRALKGRDLRRADVFQTSSLKKCLSHEKKSSSGALLEGSFFQKKIFKRNFLKKKFVKYSAEIRLLKILLWK